MKRIFKCDFCGWMGMFNSLECKHICPLQMPEPSIGNPNDLFANVPDMEYMNLLPNSIKDIPHEL